MKKLLSILLLFCTLGIADIPEKPVVHVTLSPSEVTYYSSSFDDPAKFNFKYLKWNAFVQKYKYGWTLVEGNWVREKLQKESSGSGVYIRFPDRSSGGGLIIVTPTISQPPSKK